MSDVPYAWVPVLLAAAFVVGSAVRVVRIVVDGPTPSRVIGLAVSIFAALIFVWVAWIAVAGPAAP